MCDAKVLGDESVLSSHVVEEGDLWERTNV